MKMHGDECSGPPAPVLCTRPSSIVHNKPLRPTPIGPGAPAPEGRLPASPSEREAVGGRGRCVRPARCRLPAAASSSGTAIRFCRCCRVHVDHHPIVAVHLGASRIRRTATPAVCTALWPLRRSCAWRCSPSSLLPPLRVAASLQPPRWTRTLLGALRGDRLRQDD